VPFLSALVVARNEEARLPACLACLGFADEIVIVLDRTTDRSADIARGFGARVIEGAWELEGDRRNVGLEACRGEWILEVDADERVPPELAVEIQSVIASSPFDRHPVPIDNWIGDRLVRHGWGGSFGCRSKCTLFRRGTKRWGRQRVHPALLWHGRAGPPLTHAIQHFVDQDVSDVLRRLDRYSSARAADLIESGQIGTLGGNLRRFLSRFLKCYVGRGGWREGGWGVLIALCAGLYPLLAYLKARLEPERHALRPSETMDPETGTAGTEATTARPCATPTPREGAVLR